MYINVAYLPKDNPNLEDLSVHLKINNCGHYRIFSEPIVRTYVPSGRNDYQLLYIASGKGYFYFDGQKTTVTKGNMILYRPNEPQIYCYYGEDKTEVFWVHFTGSKAEEYLEYFELPKKEHVFFTGVSPDYQWIYKQMIQELQL